MPINEKDNFIFIHIPKTAGGTLYQRLSIKRQIQNFHSSKMKIEYKGIYCSSRHIPAFLLKSLYPDMFKKFYKFSFVRNPYDRIVSEFFWCKRKTDLQNDSEEIIEKKFTKWLKNYYSTISSSRKCTQKWFLYSENSKDLLVDKIYKFENFEAEFLNLVQDLKIEVNVENNKEDIHKSKIDIDRNIILTEKNKEFIYSIFKEDFESFEYSKEYVWVPKNI